MYTSEGPWMQCPPRELSQSLNQLAKVLGVRRAKRARRGSMRVRGCMVGEARWVVGRGREVLRRSNR